MKGMIKGFTFIELMVVITILLILGTGFYKVVSNVEYPTQTEIEIKESMCLLNGEQIRITERGNMYCVYKKDTVMNCIKEYTNGIDEKYNNPDHVTNLREDEYSNVVKTCNDIFGEKDLNTKK